MKPVISPRHPELVRPFARAICLLAILLSGTSAIAQEESQDTNVEEVLVSGYDIVGSATSATGLNLSIRETPQSVSVITLERMKIQNMDTIADALRNTTGLTVKASDRGRGEVSSRGFTIQSYQLDGLPFTSPNVGFEQSQSAIYERIEVVRGATGLLNGIGDPSATINLVRKHADSREFVGDVKVEAGSWNHAGATADMTIPLSRNGDTRLRTVLSHSSSESFMDLEESQDVLFYGVVDSDLSANTRLSVGLSYQEVDRDGIYWGGLPLWFSDGSRTNLARSKTTSTDWSEWNTEETSAFVTLEHKLANDWTVKGNITYYEQEEYSNLLWFHMADWGALVMDIDTGEGMVSTPYLYGTNPDQLSLQLGVTGDYHWFGREHIFNVGLTRSNYEGEWTSGIVDVSSPLQGADPVGNFYEWDGSYPEPIWASSPGGGPWENIESAIYASSRFSVSDRFNIIAGGRMSSFERNYGVGVWQPEPESYDDSGVFIPYLGALYDLNRRFTAYVSYASIYNPNESRDRNGNILDPEMGNVYELGLKGEHFNGALYTNFAYFMTRQENFAVPDGNLVVPGTTNPAFTTTDGVEVDGYEIELVGLLSDNWELSLGWTDFTAEDQDGEDVVVNHPRKNLKMFTSYNFSDSLSGLKIGGGVNWQSEEPKYAINPVTNVEEHIGEDARSVFEVMASYKLNDQVVIQANAYNLLDEEYIESSWGTYTYGEPRNFVVSVNYTF